MQILFLCLALLNSFADEQVTITESPEYLINVAVVDSDITPPVGVPLAGYGSIHRRDLIPFSRFFHDYATWFKPSEGVHDPIRAKVMYLNRGNGQKLLFVSLDVIGISKEFREEIIKNLEPLGFNEDEIFISATHTHNGPGAIAHNVFWQMIAVDNFNDEIYQKMVKGTLGAITHALKVAEPAYLYAYASTMKNLQKNRRDDHDNSFFDPQAGFLLAKNTAGKWLGGMVNFAVHGTALGPSDLNLSADVPGSIERTLEKRLQELNGDSTVKPSVVFFNGAEGDVAPARHGYDGIQATGETFATQAIADLASARLIWPDFWINRTNVWLDSPNMSLLHCLGSGFLRYLIWSGLHVHLDLFFPDKATIYSVTLGDMIFMTWPGEPTTSLGLQLKEIAQLAGAKQAWVLGLTNDHLTYFVTPDEYKNGGYESCSCVYGADGGVKIVDGYRKMLLGQ